MCRPAAQRPPSDAGWIVDKVCLHFEKDTSWIVFGELTNNTGSDRSLVEVGVTFFDGNGTQLAQGLSDIAAETMPNGATLPFYIPIDSLNPPAQVGFSITPGGFADLTPRRDLVLSGLQLMPAGNELFLTGHVQNPGPALTDSAEVIATFYDQNGAVVALGYEFLDPLDASETVDFEIRADGLLEFVTDFRVVVYGY